MTRNDLQTYIQQNRIGDLPVYHSECRGPDHEREYRTHICVGEINLKHNNKTVYSDWYKNKKKAESCCAKKVLNYLNQQGREDLNNKYQEQKKTRLQQQEQQKIEPPSPPQQQQQTTYQTKQSIDSLFSKFISIDKNNIKDELIEKQKNDGNLLSGGFCNLNFNEPTQTEKDNEIERLKRALGNLQQRVDTINSIFQDENCNNLTLGQIKTIGIPIIKTLQQGDDGKPIEMNKSEPRDYQCELYRKSMEKDIICCLPTGLGKTLISCMVIKKMKQLNPSKQIVFIVDRIPLVIQQSGVIETETGLKVLSAHGETFKAVQLKQRFDVLVVIGDLFNKLLSSGDLNILSFCLIVIDEAHHIVKEHSFAKLLRDKLNTIPEVCHPKILGLTASPAGKKDFFNTLLSLKLISKVSRCEIIKPTHQSIIPYINQKNIKIISIPTNNLERHSIQILKDLISKYKPNLSNNQELFDSVTSVIDSNTLKGLGVVGGGGSSGGGGGGSTQNHNLNKFLSSFFEKINDFINFKMFGSSIPVGLNLKSFLSEEVLNIDDLELQTEILSMVCSLPGDKEIADSISKLEIALQILDEKKSDDLKAIIFVKTRDVAKKVHSLLDQLRMGDRFSFIKPNLVVGHGSIGGMSISSQKKAIEEFRSDQCNVIVATSVVEEGFDVPECNIVIRLDPPTTVTANIQSRGRLRNRDSYFYGIVKVDDPREDNIYEFFKNQERYLEEAINFLKTGEIPISLKQQNYTTQVNQVDEEMDTNSYFASASALVQEMVIQVKRHTFDFDISWEHTLDGSGFYNATATFYINKEAVNSHFKSGQNKKTAKENTCKSILQSGLIYNLIKNLE
ncbi:hypothetical protein ACTFIR_012670 [Dictyostelium discoideum]